MRVVMASAELSPVATVGGLAAAVAGLSLELRRSGVTVDVVIPDYGDVELVDERVIDLDVPAWARPAVMRIGDHPAVGRLHLVSAPGLARPHPYLQPDGVGWHDNDARFMAFSQGIAAFVRSDPPDIVHLNDWHTAPVLAALDGSVPAVFSIHNLAHQGRCPQVWLHLMGPRAAHYEWFGGTNPLTGAVALADAIVAVSPTYASEILTPAGGCGVHEALESRRSAVRGILNGIDTEVWDPAGDPYLPVAYDSEDPSGKDAARGLVLERFGFADDGDPLIAMVTRLTEQKGIDLVVPLIGALDQIPARLIVLGSGDRSMAEDLAAMAGRHGDRFAFVEGYDEAFSHLLIAGADLFAMPSRFEPCGLTQMQAMRYGTIPVVTAVGGLIDTVPDVDAEPRRGRGFVAQRAESVDLALALGRAARRHRDRRRWMTLRKRVMGLDWSWRQPAGEYLSVYRALRSTTGYARG